MTENEVLFEMSRIVNGHLTYPQAVEQIELLLDREAPAESPKSRQSIQLRAAGESLGQVVLSLAPNQAHLAAFIGEQLGMLLARTRLADRRAQLKAELAKMDKDLATRKLMQRAEGLLIARRGMLAVAARQWIAQQSAKTGMSKEVIADRIVAYYQATGLMEQKIA